MGLLRNLKAAVKTAGTLLGGAPPPDIPLQIEKLRHGIRRRAFGRTRDRRAQLEYFMDSPGLHRAVRPAALGVASARWKLYALRGREERTLARSVSRAARPDLRKGLIETLPEGVEALEVASHPLLTLLTEGSPELVGHLTMYLTEVARTLPGEAYWLLEPNADLVPYRAWYIPPNWVDTWPSPESPWYEVRLPRAASVLRVPEAWMLAFREPDPTDPYFRGSALGRTIADEVEADEQAAKQIRLFFESGMKPEVLLYGKGLERRERRDALETEWRDKLAGVYKRWQLHTMSVAGDAKVMQLSQDFEAPGLVDLRKYYSTVGRELVGTPPEIVGEVGNSNRATSYMAKRHFCDWVLIPRLEYYRAVCQARLIPLYESPRPLVLDYELASIEDEESAQSLREKVPYTMSWAQTCQLQGVEPPEGADEIHLLPVGVVARTRDQLLGGGAPPAPAPEPDLEPKPEAALKKKLAS